MNHASCMHVLIITKDNRNNISIRNNCAQQNNYFEDFSEQNKILLIETNINIITQSYFESLCYYIKNLTKIYKFSLIFSRCEKKKFLNFENGQKIL